MNVLKSILTFSLAVAALGSGASFAADPPFPTKPINIVVPYPPGGSSDVIPRMLSPLLSKSLGVTIVIENKPGANGSIGAAQIARSEPGGYNLLMVPTGVMAVNQWLYKKPTYNPEKDFTPIILVGETPHMMVVHPKLGIKTLPELIALAKAKPGTLSFASSGAGSTSHLCGEQFKSLAKIDIVHIPYKGPAPAAQDLLGGQVTMMCEAFPNMIGHVRAGKLNVLAIATKSRFPQAPEIPTGAEGGVAGLEAATWFGFVAPQGTSRSVIERLNKDFALAIREPSISKRLVEMGFDVAAGSPEDFGQLIASESAKWRKVLDSAGVKID